MSLYVEIEKSLRDFDLKARFQTENEVLAILGASGCGKSMTLKCIAGIETPDRGRIELDGKVLFDSERRINLPPQQRRVGYLFQNYALFSNMTVAENIAFVAKGTKPQRKEIVAKQIKLFCLDGLENAHPANLSGGQQQRVALARILASEAKLLMLDEPFSALDSYLRWQMEQEITKALEAYPCSTLFVSHDRDEVYRICDRAAVMSQGRMEPIRVKRELFENPETLAGTRLTGCKNISTACKLDSHTLFAEEWGLTLRAAQPVPDGLRFVGFRAHFFTDGAQSANGFAAEIVKVVESMFSFIVMVRPRGMDGKPLRWELEKDAWRAMDKEELFLAIPEDKLILMER